MTGLQTEEVSAFVPEKQRIFDLVTKKQQQSDVMVPIQVGRKKY